MPSPSSPRPAAPSGGRAPEVVALGEVMLRLDPGEQRIRSARGFAAHEGGGEYNVARALRTAFGLPAAVVTALVDDEVGRLVEDLVLASGVDTRWVRWLPAGGPVPARNGLNFTERGHGARGAVGVSDRARTAASRLAPGDVPWPAVLAGARWFHTGGVFAGLSPTTTATALHAAREARRLGVPVSVDTNFRPSLWRGRGGRAEACATARALAGACDVLIGTAWDLFPDVDDPPAEDPVAARAAFERGVARIRTVAPGVRVVATTCRAVRSASRNGWGALGWSAEDGVHASVGHGDLEILDRVGGGDAFAAGLVAGLLRGAPLPEALDLGVASGALAMTTPGDAARGRLADVHAAAALRPAAIAW
ncbi:sugar kinase [Cellulomonas sp. PS-H5]|uniref:sugar kinase n=1 Tax=Cellulomonas sp. PS-H5 TaxID=2820400 RepID=UPI001C4EC886|nr:sugar kinase [Cellulomonas sp. PS-H5]MBW0255417.1 sugar kinase [Cellulomonas sp. PS-H5]